MNRRWRKHSIAARDFWVMEFTPFLVSLVFCLSGDFSCEFFSFVELLKLNLEKARHMSGLYASCGRNRLAQTPAEINKFHGGIMNVFVVFIGCVVLVYF